MIVNNRPDGEEPGQPAGDEIKAAAEAAGLDYRHIPVAGGFSPGPGRGDGRRAGEAEGKGPRFLPLGHALDLSLGAGRARAAAPTATPSFAQAAAAGYDLSPLRPYLG